VEVAERTPAPESETSIQIPALLEISPVTVLRDLTFISSCEP
jgi:hypothetical protein